MDPKQLLSTILTVPGLSGREDPILETIKKQFEPYCDEVYFNKTNSVIGVKRGTRSFSPADHPSDSTTVAKRLMFAAHLDQIGLFVLKIETGGFLRFNSVGYDHKALPGQQVLIYGKHASQPILGIVCSVSSSIVSQEESEKPTPMAQLYIDTGLSETLVCASIQVGDAVIVQSEPMELKGETYIGPAMDDRVCIAALILGMERLKSMHHEWDIYFVATSGEESTGIGARTSAYDIQPDAACVLDVSFADQTNSDSMLTNPQGKGITIALGPIYDRRLRKKMIRICKEEGIPYQDDPDSMGFGTDAASIRMTRGGTAVNLIGIPIKYMHQPVEMIHLNDLIQMGRFVAFYAANIHRSEDSNDSIQHKD